MKSPVALAILVICGLVISPVGSVQAQGQSFTPFVNRGISYLLNNYNATIGLDHESPNSLTLRNTYWLYSDNFLVYLALSHYPDNVTLALRAQNISRSMSTYLYGRPNPLNQYLALDTGLWAFNSSTSYAFAMIDGATIKATINNGSSALDPRQYADVAFLEVSFYLNNGRTDYAQTVYYEGLNNWDGYGFKDIAFTGGYDTYKLALYIYASKILGQSFDQSALLTLLGLQQADGGFATSYVQSGRATSGTNTETTALAILALITPSATQPTNAQNTILIIALLGGGLAAGLLGVILIRRYVR